MLIFACLRGANSFYLGSLKSWQRPINGVTEQPLHCERRVTVIQNYSAVEESSYVTYLSVMATYMLPVLKHINFLLQKVQFLLRIDVWDMAKRILS